MSSDNNPPASQRTGGPGPGCFLGFGGLVFLFVILINGAIVRNNQMIMQNQIRQQELRRQMQENEQQRLLNQQRRLR